MGKTKEIKGLKAQVRKRRGEKRSKQRFRDTEEREGSIEQPQSLERESGKWVESH